MLEKIQAFIHPDRAERSRNGTQIQLLRHCYLGIFHYRNNITKTYTQRGKYTYITMEFHDHQALIWLFGANWHRRIYKNAYGDVVSDCRIMFAQPNQVDKRYSLITVY